MGVVPAAREASGRCGRWEQLVFGKPQKSFCEVQMVARRTIPTVLVSIIVCCLSPSTCPRLHANEKSESEVYTSPLGRLAKAKANLKLVDFTAMRLAIEDLTKNFPDKYKNGREYLRAIDIWQRRAAEIATTSTSQCAGTRGRMRRTRSVGTASSSWRTGSTTTGPPTARSSSATPHLTRARSTST